ncbi:MAG: hypothetical protein P1U87_22870 [Verrucomicrobiales bacterium]|nr:hypothetical protein [Verrucomicrobiales bacterium]
MTTTKSASSKTKKKPTLKDLHELLRKHPVNFRRAADLTKRRGMGVPLDFMASIKMPKAKKGEKRKFNKVWAEAVATMTTLMTRPPNWQWDSSDLEDVSDLSARGVERAIAFLKQHGWIGHVNVYIDGEVLSTYIMVFDEQLKEEDRVGRWSLCWRSGKWRMKSPSGVIEEVEAPAWSKKNPKVEPPTNDEAEEAAEEDSLFPQHVPGHNISSKESSSQTLLRRAQEDDPLPAALPESEVKPEGEIDRPVEEVHVDLQILENLEILGRKANAEDDFDSRLEYEEFIDQHLLPRLKAPPRDRPRAKVWNLHWAQNSMWGMLFKRLSFEGQDWNNNQARRLVKRVTEGYISPEGIRTVLFMFDWERQKKTLENWTFRGKRTDVDGNFEITDVWQRQHDNSYTEMKYEGTWQLVAAKHALCPPAAEAEIPEQTVRLVQDFTRKMVGRPQAERREMLATCYGLRDPEVLAYITTFTAAPLPPEITSLMREDQGRLLDWLATDLSGIRVFQEFGWNFHPDLGEDFRARVVARHHEFVPKLIRRLKLYRLSTEGVRTIL